MSPVHPEEPPKPPDDPNKPATAQDLYELKLKVYELLLLLKKKK